jgi:hypothetical protein
METPPLWHHASGLNADYALTQGDILETITEILSRPIGMAKTPAARVLFLDAA